MWMDIAILDIGFFPVPPVKKSLILTKVSNNYCLPQKGENTENPEFPSSSLDEFTVYAFTELGL